MSRTTFGVRSISVVTATMLISSLFVPVSAASAAAPFTPRVVVAMGDSITRGAVADGTPTDNSRHSWSTGSSATVQSHATRLAEAAGWAPAAYNYALGGTTSDDLARQANSAVGREADYVTILSGGNDVCRSTSLEALPDPATVAANYAAALKIINTERPNARIFIASIPNMRKLHDAGVKTVVAPLVWAAAGVCPLAMGDALDFSPAAEKRRATVESYIGTINDVIAKTCERASLCFHDGGAVFDMPVEISNVSTLDYFHPSVNGQTALAEITWAKAVDAGVFAAVQPPKVPSQPSTPSPTGVVVDETSRAINWTGGWGSTRSPLDRGGSVAYLRAMKSSFSLTFTGTRVSLVARTTPTAGISEISIDGIVVAKVNSYSPEMEFDQTVFTSKTLAPGKHTVTVTPTADLPPGSTGRNLVFDAFIIDGVTS